VARVPHIEDLRAELDPLFLIRPLHWRLQLVAGTKLHLHTSQSSARKARATCAAGSLHTHSCRVPLHLGAESGPDIDTSCLEKQMKCTFFCRSQMLLSGVQSCWSKSASASSSRIKNVSASVIKKYGVCIATAHTHTHAFRLHLAIPCCLFVQKTAVGSLSCLACCLHTATRLSLRKSTTRDVGAQGRRHLDCKAARQLDNLLLDPAADTARMLAGDALQGHWSQLWCARLIAHHPHLDSRDVGALSAACSADYDFLAKATSAHAPRHR
jgi:hypothetical protein